MPARRQNNSLLPKFESCIYSGRKLGQWRQSLYQSHLVALKWLERNAVQTSQNVVTKIISCLRVVVNKCGNKAQARRDAVVAFESWWYARAWVDRRVEQAWSSRSFLLQRNGLHETIQQRIAERNNCPTGVEQHTGLGKGFVRICRQPRGSTSIAIWTTGNMELESQVCAEAQAAIPGADRGWGVGTSATDRRCRPSSLSRRGVDGGVDGAWEEGAVRCGDGEERHE